MNDRLALDLLQRFAMTLVREYDLDDVLTELAGRLRAVVQVEGAGVMLADDDGNLRLTSSSDERLETLEDLQIELDEGPCLMAYRERTRIIALDLANDPRFPRFGPRAIEHGMRSVFSFPLHYDGRAFGALNLYRSEPGVLTDDQADMGAAMADVATLYLMHGADDEIRERINRQLQGALDSRVVIEQAKGFIAARCGVDAETAFTLLRNHARRNGRKLRELARQVVAGTVDVEELGVPAASV